MQTIQLKAQVDIQPILAHCKRRLQQHYADRFKALILYGSAAKQQLTPQSDLDLLVLLEPHLDYSQELRTIVDLLYPLQLDASHWISAKPAATTEFEQGLTQLYRNIHQEGIAL